MRTKKINLDSVLENESPKVKELKRQLFEQAKKIKQYHSEHGKLEVFFDQVISEVKTITPLATAFRPDKSRGKSRCVAVIQNSDWHTGEVQIGSEIEFINSYDPVIQQGRIEQMDQIFLRWLETMRTSYSVDDCEIIVTGDLISGDIHRELSVTNAYPVPVQVCEAARMLSESIATRAPHFKNIRVDFIVPDNHGRLTEKPQAKEAGMNSFNYIVAVMAKQYLAKHKNVNFLIHPEMEKVIEVNGIRYLCSHGNNIRGWTGIPWYSVERHVGKEAKSRQHIIMQDISIERLKNLGFNKYLFGHFHQPFNSDLYACCGSLSGTSAYDHASGRFSLPSQDIWLVHEKHGELNKTSIKLK